jgi:hypothetical protein
MTATAAAPSSDVLQRFRPLAVARNWDDLRNAIRARCDEFDVSRQTVDRVGGLPDGQTAKLLAPVRRQEMGRISFPAMLGALGLAVVVVEDRDAIAGLRHRLTPRSGHAQMLTDDVLRKSVRENAQRKARRLGAAIAHGGGSWRRGAC